MIEIKNISNKSADQKQAILEIIKSLPDFFMYDGMAKELKENLEIHKIFGAFEGDKLVGFITLRDADVAAMEISWLAVLREYQGKGIGYNLVKAVLNQLANEGFTLCYVKTLAEIAEDAGYAKTRAFYKSLGFNTLEIISPYPNWTGDNPCQIMAVALPIK